MGASQSSENSDSLNDDISQIKRRKKITLYIHDEEYTGECHYIALWANNLLCNLVKADDITPSTTLNFYLRNILHLTGTKAMCREGGCGACIVVLQRLNPITRKNVFLAVNSCLVPVLSCNGWRIYTIEGLGNSLNGYHPLQTVLAKFNGTQCGFCSPGMVMNMYALYKSKKLTMADVENSFGGNICRCTGYRPILSAFKSLCKDADTDTLGHYPDIEDLRLCEKDKCKELCMIEYEVVPESYYYLNGDSKWMKVRSLQDLLQTLSIYPNSSYKLVAGDTAQGVFKSYANPVQIYIDISSVIELVTHEFNENSLILGANTTLSDAIDLFQNFAKDYSNFAYLKQLAKHIDLVANVPVRNRATLAGNLMMKYHHNEFPSDIFLILETVGALLTVVSVTGEKHVLTPEDFIKFDMKMRVLVNVILPVQANTEKYVSYKIMPRAQNAHANVNAGFLFKFHSDSVLDEATIVFGNINPTFIHAVETEKFLKGKKLFDSNVLQQAYAILSKELDPDLIPPDPAPEFRKNLAISLFYKAVLSIAPVGKISPQNRSGGTVLERPISKGTQDYETNASLYPVTQAIPKIEALLQTSGQAQYVDDMPDMPHQLFGALVLAEAAPNSIIKNINPQKALELESIVAFFSKRDIPGDNNFTPLGIAFMNNEEEIFCSGRVQYYEQPIGILVGTSEKSVIEAVSLVEVIYDAPNVEPLLSVRQILKSDRSDRIHKTRTIPAKRKGDDIKHVIKGSFDIYHQYHFHMETQSCNVIPTENGLDVYPSSQWMDLTQIAIANMLKIPNNKINVTIRRCGGAFGAKISRNGLIACAAALASWKLRQPVKLSLPLTTNIAAIGKRWPLSTDYEVGVSENGVIQYLDCTHYCDVGAIINEDNESDIISLFTENYDSDTFNIETNKVVTDTHTNTWARAPGTTEGLGSIEAIMDHISYAVNMDPLELRVANFRNNSPLVKYLADLKSWADIDKRKQDISIFNKNNRWKKKGISIVPMTYELSLNGPYAATVSIFHGDGTVQISHGGVEIGQGVNTKAVQVCAYKLGLPLEKIVVIPSNSFISANSTATASSITSEAICYGIVQACDQLLERIEPYKQKYPTLTWEQLIQKCFENYVDLTARGQYSPKESNLKAYQIYGICATEVLLDVLTGQYIISRVDLLEDTGQTLSPEIDIGQIEGAFIMGVGYYTTEQIVFNYEGKILTNNTWTYHPPGPKDIPVNFNLKFPKNNPNPVGILKSKATGEPAVCLSVSVPLAIRNAVASARSDADATKPKWYPFDGPTSVENVFMNSLNDYKQYVL